MKADLRNEKLGYKIREAQLQKIPFMLVVGDREVEQDLVSVRNRYEGDQGTSSVAEFAAAVEKLVKQREVRP